jgi:hypothetical protein
VPRAFLKRTIQDLNEYVQSCVPELILNLVEVRISDWEDRQTRNAFVPTTRACQTIHHAISRNVKHISRIVGSLTAGESLAPYIGTSQISSPVQEHLRKHGIEFARDFIVRANQTPSIYADIFIDYIKTLFLSYLVELRRLAAITRPVPAPLSDRRDRLKISNGDSLPRRGRALLRHFLLQFRVIASIPTR